MSTVGLVLMTTHMTSLQCKRGWQTLVHLTAFLYVKLLSQYTLFAKTASNIGTSLLQPLRL